MDLTDELLRALTIFGESLPSPTQDEEGEYEPVGVVYSDEDILIDQIKEYVEFHGVDFVVSLSEAILAATKGNM
jgi:hypothetical protein